MKSGTLYLIKSKYPPVFKTPMPVYYVNKPVVDESFMFTARGFNSCHLSVTKRIETFEGFKLIFTLNSVYVLIDAQETPND